MGNVQSVHGDIGERWLDDWSLLGVGPFIGFHGEGVAERKLQFIQEGGVD
jgi:hypothetical protein